MTAIIFRPAEQPCVAFREGRGAAQFLSHPAKFVYGGAITGKIAISQGEKHA
jgi:hypothetical protein